MDIDDTWAWVSQGPERQLDAAAGAHGAAEDAPIFDDDMPQVVPPPPRTQEKLKFMLKVARSIFRRHKIYWQSFNKISRYVMFLLHIHLTAVNVISAAVYKVTTASLIFENGS
ncbi:hypothetical protein Tco_0654189 [Tanacetum coccineum]|uniref:Uncharacterized protein n=1 Tax=Tanacetum coccineum TaxID=301880 RepID=A0ABQ4X321_9ASTR